VTIRSLPPAATENSLSLEEARAAKIALSLQIV